MIKQKCLTILLLLALSHCGGGGGGGSDSGSSTGVRVLHGAIDAAPVDLTVDSDGVLETVRFGEAGDYQALAEGTHAISTFRTKDLVTPLFSRSVTSDGNQKFTILLHGDRSQFGLRSALISEEIPEVPSGAGLVRIIHGVVGAATIASSGAAAVDAQFGAASKYAPVAPGVASFRLVRKADGALLGRADFAVEEGRAYSIFLGGEADYLVKVAILEE